MESQNYLLSISFFLHHKAVRAIDILGPAMISGSIDMTCQIFNKTPEKFHFQTAVTLFDDYIYAVLVRPAFQGFIVGCKDGKIYLLDQEGNPVGILEGHQGAISSLSIEGLNYLVSGSWDTTAKLWDLKTGTCLFTMEGHSYAVAVLGYKYVITGSQDGKLHFWSFETGKRIRSIEKAHGDIIREIARVESVGGFISCSNDETFKLWTLEGELLHLFQGHESYVFSAKCLGFGLFVSGSDDRTVRIWSQQTGLLQTIEHPNTVWHVAVDHESGDIVTACADGAIRVFTNEKKRIAPEDELREFEKSCEAAKAQVNPGLSQAELEKLPSVTSLHKHQGKNDGEIRLFRNGALAEAFVWKAAEGKWEKIGDVISGNQRKYYEGDRYFEAGEYDYVFDVDMDANALPSKLPYNEGDNPLETADKFLAREGLNKGYIEQITSFIRNNTRGINKSANKSSQSYNVGPKKEPKTSFKYFPVTQYLSFEGMNQAGMLKKTLESNEILKSQGSKLAMTEKEVKYFSNILDILSDTKSYHSSQLTPFELDFVRGKLLNWPIEVKISIFDLLRVYLLHSQSEVLFSGLNAGLDILTDICGVLQGKAGPNEALIGLCLKVLTNLFLQVTNQNSALNNCSIIFDSILVILNNYQNKPNIMNICASLVLNYSIAMAINFLIPENEVKRFGQILATVLRSTAQNNGQILKILVAIGTLLVSNKKGYIPVIKETVRDTIGSFQSTIKDSELEKVEESLRDIREDLLSS